MTDGRGGNKTKGLRIVGQFKALRKWKDRGRAEGRRKKEEREGKRRRVGEEKES